jgi:hypothetical protein
MLFPAIAWGPLTVVLSRSSSSSSAAPHPTPPPDPAPMPSFRGQPMTHEAAEGIKAGWLAAPAAGGAPAPGGSGDKAWSWLVAAGKNPA